MQESVTEDDLHVVLTTSQWHARQTHFYFRLLNIEFLQFATPATLRCLCLTSVRTSCLAQQGLTTEKCYWWAASLHWPQKGTLPLLGSFMEPHLAHGPKQLEDFFFQRGDSGKHGLQLNENSQDTQRYSCFRIHMNVYPKISDQAD